MEIHSAFERFIRECQDGTLPRRAERTIANYRHSMCLLLKSFPLQNVTDLNEGVLRQHFRRGEQIRSWSANTALTHRKNLAPFLDWCVVQGHLNSNPLEEIPRPQLLQKTPEYYSDEEIERILYAVAIHAYSDFEKARNTAIMATLLMTGIRKGELIRLKVTDVDFENSCIRIRAENAKNRKPRVVCMAFRLRELLRAYWDARQARGVETFSFWVSSTHNRSFTEHGFKHFFERMSKQAGVRVKAHKCRHTFATKFYQGSRDITALQQILGHGRITTTMIYAHVIPENTKASLEKNPLNSLF